MSEHRASRPRYTPKDDVLIKKLYMQGWGQWEIAYRLTQKYGGLRGGPAVGQRIARLHSEGMPKRTATVSSITQETVDWAKEAHGIEIEPSAQMKLAEIHPRQKRKSKKRPHRSTVKRNGVSTRELLGFTKTKSANEPRPSYAVFILRAERQNPQILALFEGLLETALDERKTAVDILDDLRLARA